MSNVDDAGGLTDEQLAQAAQQIEEEHRTHRQALAMFSRERLALEAAIEEREDLLRQIAKLNPLRRDEASTRIGEHTCVFGCSFLTSESGVGPLAPAMWASVGDDFAMRQAHIQRSPMCLWIQAQTLPHWRTWVGERAEEWDRQREARWAQASRERQQREQHRSLGDGSGHEGQG
jgi:hypothetical protein